MAIVKLISSRLLTEQEACAKLGHRYETWLRWKAKNENNEVVQELLAEGRADVLDRCLTRIEKSMDGQDVKQPDWRAAAWIAEKTAPERFGSKQVEAVQNNTLNVQVMLDSVRRVFANASSAPAQALLSAPADNVLDVEEKPLKSARRGIPKRKSHE